jgi:hypothetical protein
LLCMAGYSSLFGKWLWVMYCQLHTIALLNSQTIHNKGNHQLVICRGPGMGTRIQTHRKPIPVAVGTCFQTLNQHHATCQTVPTTPTTTSSSNNSRRNHDHDHGR